MPMHTCLNLTISDHINFQQLQYNCEIIDYTYLMYTE